MTGLYIHIPFCLKKCVYCDFYSVPYNGATAEAYKNAVLRNIRDYLEKGAVFDTLYFGGGTPSLLWREVCEITEALRVKNAEVTIEANPSDITPEMLNALLNAGVNRVSIGAQSLNDAELAFLTRRHNAETAYNAVRLAEQAGFKNISADIMLGIPEQTAQTIERTIDALSFVNHISAYQLTVHGGRITAADDDVTAELYLKTIEILRKNGFAQYEISNFSKTGYECRHNLKYWLSREYIGIGAAAHSYYKNRRFAVPKDVDLFINSPLQETYTTEEHPGDFEERAMLRLRLTEGLPISECEELLARSKTLPRRFFRVSGGRFALSEEGFLVSNKILAELF